MKKFLGLALVVAFGFGMSMELAAEKGRHTEKYAKPVVKKQVKQDADDNWNGCACKQCPQGCPFQECKPCKKAKCRSCRPGHGPKDACGEPLPVEVD